MTSRANTGVALSALYRYIPALDSLRSYRFSHFRADFVAGLTVATVAVPQAMAYALVGRGSTGIWTLHRHRHDRRRRDFRLLAPTHQRAHQRHFDCRAQRGGSHSARRPPAGRHSAGISCRAAPGGHHPGQARGPDALHLAFGHRRLHFRCKPAAGAGPVEEPAGPAQHGPGSRLLSGALLGHHDAGRLPALAHGADRARLHCAGCGAAVAQDKNRAQAASRPAHHRGRHGRDQRPAGARSPGRQGCREDPGQAALPGAAQPGHPLPSPAFIQRPGHRHPGPAGGHLHGQGHRGPHAPKNRLQPTVPLRRPGQPFGLVLPVHPGLRLADPLLHQPAGRRRNPVVGGHIGLCRGRHRSGLCALCQVHPPSLHGRHPDDFILVHGGLEAARLPRAGLALRRGRGGRYRPGGNRHQHRVLRAGRGLHVVSC